MRFQLCYEFSVEVFEVVYNVICQASIEMIMLYGFVDFEEADTVYHFWICFAVYDGGMNGAVAKSRSQCAFYRIKNLGLLLHVGLYAASIKYQFPT